MSKFSKYAMYVAQAEGCERAASEIADEPTRKSLLYLAWQWRRLAERKMPQQPTPEIHHQAK